MQIARTLAAARRRIARPLVHGLARPLVMARIARPSEAGFLGRRLRTHPEVFHPVLFRSSRILVEHLLERPLRGLRLLDMGTGAGPVAVVASAEGAIVTACDINPRAVALARDNCALNGVRAEVIESDLFAALGGRTFDLVCFNVPFYAREPTTWLEAAFYAGSEMQTVRRFARGCADHLAPGGRVVVVFSEECEDRAMVVPFEEMGLRVERRSKSRRLLEYFHVVWFQRGS